MHVSRVMRLIAVLCILTVAPGLVKGQIRNLRVAHIGPLVGQNARPDIALGIQAALEEADDNNDLPSDTTVTLVAENEEADVRAQAIRLAQSRPPLAFVGSVGYDATNAVRSVAEARGVPLVGAATGLSDLRTPFNRRIVNIRMSDSDEINRLMSYVLQRRFFWRIACLYEDTEFGRRAKDHINELLEESGRPLWGDGRFDPTADSVDVSGIFADGPPQAIAIFTTHHDTAVRALVASEQAFATATGKLKDTAYLLISSLNIDAFVNEIPVTSSEIIITSSIPLPSSKYAVATHFRAAATARGIRHTFDAMEGYLIGRLIVETLKRSTSSDSFNDNIIYRGLITIDNVRLGPFTDACQPDQIGLCDCNQGGRDFYMIGMENGRIVLKNDEPVVSLPMSRCNHTNRIPLPLVFAQLFPSEQNTGDLDDLAGLMSIGVYAKFKEANEKFEGINGRHLMYFRYAYNGTAENAAEVANVIRSAVPVVAFVCNVGTESVDLGVPQLSTLELRPEVIQSPFKRDIIKMDPSVQMEMLAIVDFIRSKNLGKMHFLHPGDPRSHRAADMFVQTAHHYQIAHAPTTVCPLLPNILFDIPEPNIIIWDDCYFQWVYFLNQTTLGGDTNHRIFIFNRDMIRLFYKFAFSDEVVKAPLMTRVFITLSATKVGLFKNMAGSVKSFLTQGGHSTADEAEHVPGPATYSGYLAATAIQTMMYRSPRNQTTSSDDFMHTWYEASILVMDSVKIGPYSDVSCGGEASIGNTGDCECNEGASRVSVGTVLTILEGYAPYGSHALSLPSGCRITLRPLFTEDTTTTIIAASTSGVVFLFVVALVVWTVWLRKTAIRDNAAAPKDETKPFCVLFTDIQSSTSLWAGVPTIMAKALEAHHAEIRKLVRKHKCYEVKTIGDAFMIVCENPAPGVALALDIQRVFYKYAWGTTEIDEMYKEMAMRAWDEAQPDEREHLPPLLTGDEYEALWSGLRVRVGVHYGMGEIKYDTTTKGYDYYGTVVNTAARVESVCHGGQVGMTGVAYDVIKISGVRVDMLGECMLRGLSEPITLYQVLPEELGERRFPPLRLDSATINEYDDEGSVVSSQSSDASAHSRTMTHQQLVVLLKRDPMVMDNVFTVDQAVMFHNISVELLGSLLGVMDDAASRKLLKEWCTLLSVPYHNPRKESVSQLLRHGITMRMLPSAMRKVAEASPLNRVSSFHLVTNPLRFGEADLEVASVN